MSSWFLAALAFAEMASAQNATVLAAAAAKKAAANANMLNEEFTNYLFIICGSLAVAMMCWRVGIESVKWIRQLSSLNNDTQAYFVAPAERFASFKKHLLYAPVFSKRHNREFQMSSAINMGTLPTRLQGLFLMTYLGTNIAFCVVSIDWNADYATALKQLRNRTGILSVVNMVSSNPLLSLRNPLDSHGPRSLLGLTDTSRSLFSLWLAATIS